MTSASSTPVICYRRTGLRKTFAVTRTNETTGVKEAVDCTGCSARATLRSTSLLSDAALAALLDLDTDNPASGSASGLQFSDDAGGLLDVIIGEDDSTDETIFPLCTSEPWTTRYRLEIDVRDGDGVPKCDPALIEVVFTEMAQ